MNKIYSQCDICGRDISYGNAVLEIKRNVEQLDYDEERGLKSVTVIDADPLTTICARCGNSIVDCKELRKQMLKILSLPAITAAIDAAQQMKEGIQENCCCCGNELKTSAARVTLVRLIGQMDWSDKLHDGELFVIDGDDILTFCSACGNKMSVERLKTAVKKVLDYADRSESDNYWDPDNHDEDDDEYDDEDGEINFAPESPPILTHYSKQSIPGLTASFGDIPEAMKYVVDNLISEKHNYFVNIRGGWEIEANEPSCIQIVPENKVFDNKKLDLTIHIPFAKGYYTDELIRFMEFPLYKHFERYTFKGIPCFAFQCGTDIEKLNRIVRLLLVEVFRYTTLANIECNIIDQGLLVKPDKHQKGLKGSNSKPLVKVGDRIIHESCGPCNVTFVGTDYIGICTDEGGDCLFRTETADYILWNEKEEATWRAAVAELEQKSDERLTLPWPDSTFSHEPEGNEHYMGSHWQPFFENGVDDVVLRLKEMIEKGKLTTGYGDTHPAPRNFPEGWQAGKCLAWPDVDCGAILSVTIEKETNTFRTVYPYWSKGSNHKILLKDVLIWESGVEGQISGTFGERDVTFFDTLYLHNRYFYERGKEYEFSLAGIAYTAQQAEETEIPFTLNPDQIAWEKKLAEMRGEEYSEEDRPKTITMKGAAILMNIGEWDKDDYSFRGTIKEVKPLTDFLGQDGWAVTATVMRQSGYDPEDFDLDIAVTSRAWKAEAPPEVGQDIEGSLWLQGYLREEL